MKDQSAALITVNILETLGVIRQLLTSLRNLVGVVQIKDDQINTLRVKGRRILYQRVLEDVANCRREEARPACQSPARTEGYYAIMVAWYYICK
jgi:hypothetical protein